MSRRASYRKEVRNHYLGKAKVLKAQSIWELDMKVKDQMRKWEAEEQRQRERDRVSDLKEEAEYLTNRAVAELEAYRNILSATLGKNDKLQWDTLYDRAEFPKNHPEIQAVPSLQELYSTMGVPKKSFFELFLSGLRKKRESLEQEAEREHAGLQQAAEEHENRLRRAFLQEQAEKNAGIDAFRKDFEEGHGEAIEKYVRMVLERSTYPDSFTKDFEVSYDPIGGTIIVSYQLPNPDALPKIVEYKFVASKKEIVEKEMKKKELDSFYEDFIYQLTLRTIHEVFESVYIPQVKAVVFNGWVTGINSATGNEFTSCILSCQAERDVFESYNLAYVNPKDCVRNLKGLVAGPLHQLAPVRPIMEMNRDDGRFVESQEVLEGIDPSMNLAEMDWESFEHLVRELFSKIFSKEGAEVRVTQASRDGGVDAVAFDPDPIRGGKFVIQAKRYNNVVPVGSVRDLYGTMINEGAVKGIQVTTSYYGPDSREFVKDKPITLVDGPNLVYMLQEYGYQATIALKSKK